MRGLSRSSAQDRHAGNSDWNLTRGRLSADLLPILLGHPPSARLSLARHVLTVSLPPYFKPHPKLNPATGRVLSRPLGGEGALNTWFESSEQDVASWRRQVGLAAVVNLVIEALQVRGELTLPATKAILTGSSLPTRFSPERSKICGRSCCRPSCPISMITSWRTRCGELRSSEPCSSASMQVCSAARASARSLNGCASHRFLVHYSCSITDRARSTVSGGVLLGAL